MKSSNTSNTSNDYDKLLVENITYKKDPPKSQHSINLAAMCIEEDIKVTECVECLAKTPAFKGS